MIRVELESCVRSTHDEECAEITALLSGLRLMGDTRQWFEDDWDRLRPGAEIDVELRLDRLYDERGTLTPVPDHDVRPNALVALSNGAYRVTGPVTTFDPQDRGSFVSFRARVEVGLGEPLAVDAYLGREIEGLAIGDRVTTEGFLMIWPQ
jgi:hypothetical protein